MKHKLNSAIFLSLVAVVIISGCASLPTSVQESTTTASSGGGRSVAEEGNFAVNLSTSDPSGINASKELEGLNTVRLYVDRAGKKIYSVSYNSGYGDPYEARRNPTAFNKDAGFIVHVWDVEKQKLQTKFNTNMVPAYDDVNDIFADLSFSLPLGDTLQTADGINLLNNDGTLKKKIVFDHQNYFVGGSYLIIPKDDLSFSGDGKKIIVFFSSGRGISISKLEIFDLSQGTKMSEIYLNRTSNPENIFVGGYGLNSDGSKLILISASRFYSGDISDSSNGIYSTAKSGSLNETLLKRIDAELYSSYLQDSNSFQWSDDGKHLYLFFDNSTVVYDSSTLQLQKNITGLAGGRSISISPDGRFAVVAGRSQFRDDEYLLVKDISTGRILNESTDFSFTGLGYDFREAHIVGTVSSWTADSRHFAFLVKDGYKPISTISLARIVKAPTARYKILDKALQNTQFKTLCENLSKTNELQKPNDYFSVKWAGYYATSGESYDTAYCITRYNDYGSSGRHGVKNDGCFVYYILVHSDGTTGTAPSSSDYDEEQCIAVTQRGYVGISHE